MADRVTEGGDCPICDSGMMVPMIEQRVVTHADHWAVFGAEYSQCDYCGSSLVSPEQARRNDEKLAEARKPSSSWSVQK